MFRVWFRVSKLLGSNNNHNMHGKKVTYLLACLLAGLLA